ncbi:ABC transporter permease [Nocardioides sp.]|uniref:ABC transporter permease n=1 Tax=Nocardioides sp. TaxID=35761 RepID=UPI003D138602
MNLARVAREVLLRIVAALGIMLGASAVLFFGMNALPGDAALAALGNQSGNTEVVEQLRVDYGLNRNVFARYGDWLIGAVHGDFGTSLSTGIPVWKLIESSVRNTLALTSIVVIALLVLALLLGVVSALRSGGLVDNFIAVVSLIFVATPEFVMGAVLILVLSSGLGLLPSASLLDPSLPTLAQPSLLVLPALTLVLVTVAQATRMVRAAMIQVLDSDYIQASVLRGVPMRRIVWRHALPNASDATVQVMALTIGWLVSGVVVTEALFNYPGLGSTIVKSVASQDVSTVVAASMLVTAAYVFVQLIAEVVTILVDPKLRRGTQ